MYLALDFPDFKTTKDFLEKNHLQGVKVKVGMELFYREGFQVIDYLKENNHPIFLDLKLFDIPNTVERAMQNLAKYELDYVNVHALGGSEMIKRAKEGLSKGSDQTKLLAVTILTSMDKQTINQELGLNSTVENEVLRLARLASKSGAEGVVCSVHEAHVIERELPGFISMTPGIRLKEGDLHDQKRVATPTEARKSGASHIVIGRSITQAKNVKASYDLAIKEWRNE